MSEGQTEASIYQQAENGKTELSLMHFTIKNPHWQPPQESSVFISHLKEKVQHDAQGGPSTQLLLSEAPLCTSLQSTESATGVRTPNHHVAPCKLCLYQKMGTCPSALVFAISLSISLAVDVCSLQPDNLLASVLAHPILTASGLQGRDHRFIPPSTTASAAASVLASLSTSHLAHPSRGRSHSLLPSSVHPESTMYRSDRTVMDRHAPHTTFAQTSLFTFCSQYIKCNAKACYELGFIYLFFVWFLLFSSMTNSDSRVRSNALHSEFASAEMSLHAIYLHEVIFWPQTVPWWWSLNVRILRMCVLTIRHSITSTCPIGHLVVQTLLYTDSRLSPYQLHQQSSHPQRTSVHWQNPVPLRDLHTNSGK